MKLTYRGLTYDYNAPDVEMTDGDFGGKFRGTDWRFRNLQKLPVQLPTLDLQYRGVAYRIATEPMAQAPVGVSQTMPFLAKAPKLSVQDLARSLMLRHHTKVKNRQQALLSRSASEVGLSIAVTQHWDRIQGKIHPDFWADYDRTPVAMS